MSSEALSQLLILYGWFLLVGLIVFLMLIARFYQRFSRERTLYQFYVIPILLFGVQAVRQTKVTNDGIGHALAALAGLVLIALSLLLYRRMTVGRQ